MDDWLDTTIDAVAPAAALAPPVVAPARSDMRAQIREAVRQQVVAKYGSTGPTRKEVATALRMLVPSQRYYLEELLSNGFHPEQARQQASWRLGRPIRRQLINGWERNAKYNTARKVLGLALQTALNPHENLLRLEKSIQSAMTPRKRYAGGTDTGEMEIDVGAMQKGIELAAKINRQLGADVSVTNRVTVQILDLTDAEAPDFSRSVVEGSVEAVVAPE